MSRRRRALGCHLLVALLAACAGAPANRVHDLEGAPCDPRCVPAGSVHVLVFTSHECPIANAYAPTLRELAASWMDLPVHVFLVHVDPDLTAAAARGHARDYDLPGTILLDPYQDLARALDVRRTPEAVVLTAASAVYRGRIDDQWHALGARNPTVAHHDLRDAVAGAVRGERATAQGPPAVGCLLPEPRR